MNTADEPCKEHINTTCEPVCLVCTIEENKRLRSELLEIAGLKSLTATPSQMVWTLQKMAADAVPNKI